MKHSTLQQLDGADWGETVVLKCDRVITHSTCMLFLHRVCNREELQSRRAADDAVGAKAIRSRWSSPRQSPAEILRAPKTPPGAETLLQQVYIHVGSHTQNDKINWCFLQTLTLVYGLEVRHDRLYCSDRGSDQIRSVRFDEISDSSLTRLCDLRQDVPDDELVAGLFSEASGDSGPCTPPAWALSGRVNIPGGSSGSLKRALGVHLSTQLMSEGKTKELIFLMGNKFRAEVYSFVQQTVQNPTTHHWLL